MKHDIRKNENGDNLGNGQRIASTWLSEFVYGLSCAMWDTGGSVECLHLDFLLTFVREVKKCGSVHDLIYVCPTPLC